MLLGVFGVNWYSHELLFTAVLSPGCDGHSHREPSLSSTVPAANFKVIFASPRNGVRLSLDGWGTSGLQHLGRPISVPCASGDLAARIRTVVEEQVQILSLHWWILSAVPVMIRVLMQIFHVLHKLWLWVELMTPMLFTAIKYTLSCYVGNDEVFMPVPMLLQGQWLLHLPVFCAFSFLNFSNEWVFFSFPLDIHPNLSRFCF